MRPIKKFEGVVRVDNSWELLPGMAVRLLDGLWQCEDGGHCWDSDDAEDTVLASDYCDDADAPTFRVTITSTHRLSGEIVEASDTHEPSEPVCVDGGAHEWAHAEVRGNGGGVIQTDRCVLCGAERHTNTWATDTATGETLPFPVVSYEAGDPRRTVDLRDQRHLVGRHEIWRLALDIRRHERWLDTSAVSPRAILDAATRLDAHDRAVDALLTDLS